MSDCIINIRSESLHLLPDKAVWWSARKTLFVADVHLGKAETFQHHAIPLPSGSTQHDLGRLTRLIQVHQAETLVILGDWLHAKESHNPLIHQQVQQWRDGHADLPILLVSGNHDDRAGKLPDAWRIERAAPPYENSPFIYTHIPQAHSGGYVLSGHLHPAVQLRGHGKQQVKHPCFWVRPHLMVLPAFGSFTGTTAIHADEVDRVYLPTSQAVLPLK